MTDWRPLARSLADELARLGVLASGWRPAFEQTPRHTFVPSFYTSDEELVSGDDPGGQTAWLEAVYRDESLTTQLTPAPGTHLRWPTSSSTQPSLMARMLDLLDVSGSEQVLEVGTGTGYNAALLSHRLGGPQVTSIDLDPALVETARDRLAGLGHSPHLAAGDGHDGAPHRAPFDRIIATCAVPAIPPAWITQLSGSGLIVADVRGELASSLVVARRSGPHTVSGRFLGTPGHFMWMRAQIDNPLRRGGGFGTPYDFDDPSVETTSLPMGAFDNTDFRFVLQLMVPEIGPVGRTIRGGCPGIFLVGSAMSWVEITPDGDREAHVLYGGPHPMWPAVADAWQRWNHWGRPPRGRFGLTAHDEGHQDIWLDRDDQVVLTLASGQP